MKNNKRNYTVYPYTFYSALFIVVPLLIVLFFSFTKSTDHGYIFSMENFQKLCNSQYLLIFGRSLKIAVFSTLLCLIIGYPVAYIISKYNPSKGKLLIMLFIVPMWMNFLLRTYAWLPILGKNGIINALLGRFGLGPYGFLYNYGTILLGMIYNFLPFMILPIYTVLSKMDGDLINAAKDLGADRKTIFFKITVPLSMPGVMTGITMVFMPAVSTFVISSLLGGGQYMLVGNLIEQQFVTMGNKNLGSSISIIMMVIILISMALMNKFSDNDDKEGTGGAGLW